MTQTEKAVASFQSGYNCAQSTFMAFVGKNIRPGAGVLPPLPSPTRILPLPRIAPGDRPEDRRGAEAVQGSGYAKQSMRSLRAYRGGDPGRADGKITPFHIAWPHKLSLVPRSLWEKKVSNNPH